MNVDDPYRSPICGCEPNILPGKRLHSRLGIASFALGLGAGGMMCAAVVALTVVDGHFDQDSQPPSIVAACYSIVFGLGMNCVGIILGASGMMQARKRRFAVLGLGLNALILLGMIAAMLLSDGLPTSA